MIVDVPAITVGVGVDVIVGLGVLVIGGTRVAVCVAVPLTGAKFVLVAATVVSEVAVGTAVIDCSLASFAG
jgi:hypothetical protein